MVAAFAIRPPSDEVTEAFTSEIATERLVQDLDGVEYELRRANLPVLSKNVPERLRRTIASIKSDKDQSSATDDFLRELGYSPFLRRVVALSIDVVRTVTIFRV